MQMFVQMPAAAPKTVGSDRSTGSEGRSVGKRSVDGKNSWDPRSFFSTILSEVGGGRPVKEQADAESQQPVTRDETAPEPDFTDAVVSLLPGGGVEGPGASPVLGHGDGTGAGIQGTRSAFVQVIHTDQKDLPIGLPKAGAGVQRPVQIKGSIGPLGSAVLPAAQPIEADVISTLPPVEIQKGSPMSRTTEVSNARTFDASPIVQRGEARPQMDPTTVATSQVGLNVRSEQLIVGEAALQTRLPVEGASEPTEMMPGDFLEQVEEAEPVASSAVRYGSDVSTQDAQAYVGHRGVRLSHHVVAKSPVSEAPVAKGLSDLGPVSVMSPDQAVQSGLTKQPSSYHAISTDSDEYKSVDAEAAPPESAPVAEALKRTDLDLVPESDRRIDVRAERSRLAGGSNLQVDQSIKFLPTNDDVNEEGAMLQDAAAHQSVEVISVDSASTGESAGEQDSEYGYDRSGGGQGDGATDIGDEAGDGQLTFDATLHRNIRSSANLASGVRNPARFTVPAEPHALGDVIRSVSLESAEQAQVVRVELVPRDMGRLQLRVSMENGSVTAMIMAESEATRQVIEAAMPQLRQALQASGLSVGSLNVSVDSGSDGFAGQDALFSDGGSSRSQGSKIRTVQSYHQGTPAAIEPRESLSVIDLFA